MTADVLAVLDFAPTCNYTHCDADATTAVTTPCRHMVRVYCEPCAEGMHANLTALTPMWCPKCREWLPCFDIERLDILDKLDFQPTCGLAGCDKPAVNILGLLPCACHAARDLSCDTHTAKSHEGLLQHRLALNLMHCAHCRTIITGITVETL